VHTFTEENYLKALLTLSEREEQIGVKELSTRLGITMPTVTAMMKRLAGKNLVHYESYKPLRLTEEGRRQSALIVRKHRLTEMFLVQVMGFGWEQVHDIAEQIEHVNIDAFFERMDAMLGHPQLDPHGSPIPDAQGHITSVGLIKLSEARAGQAFQLQAVLDSSNAFLSYLNSRSLSLGTTLEVVQIEPFDGTMQIDAGQGELVLSKEVCARLLGKV
jgi:DtxR family transcriptional regulator, Mn-dependent transcriptional regulator